MILQGRTCVFVHVILQFSSSQDTDTNTNHVQYIMYKYKEYCKDMLISIYFSSSDNTKLEAFYIVTFMLHVDAIHFVCTMPGSLATGKSGFNLA